MTGKKRIIKSVMNDFGFFDWLRYRNEEKKKRIKEMKADVFAKMEIMMMKEDEWTPEKEVELLQKYRKMFGLD